MLIQQLIYSRNVRMKIFVWGFYSASNFLSHLVNNFVFQNYLDNSY